MRSFIISFFLVLLAISFTSCSRKTIKAVSDRSFVIFPPPPATPRIQFLTSISGSNDIAHERSRFMKYVLGEEQPLKINKPYGIAIKNGKIYICDTMLGGLIIIDLAKNTFEYFTPDGFGQLKKPINCAVDDDGRLYVADAGRNQIVVFDSAGNFVTSFGEKNFGKATDVAVLGNKIYVADIKDHHIYVYSKNDYTQLKSFPDVTENSPAFLHSPANLEVIQNQIYISDLGAFGVKIFDLDGNYLSTFGGYGNTVGRFVRPKGIAADKDLNVHVVDAGFENIQIFDKSNQLLMFYGGNYDGKGKMWLPAAVCVDYDNLGYFQKFVHPGFKLKYILLVTNQFGPDKVNVYGFLE